MYTHAKYIAKTENGYTVERQYLFDEGKKKLGTSVPGTTAVYDSHGHDVGRGDVFEMVMSLGMDDYSEEAAILMCADDDMYDVPSSIAEAEQEGYYESRSVDTVEVSDGDIRVFSKNIF